MGDKGSTSTSTSNIQLSPEAQEQLTKELGFFSDVVEPGTNNQLNQLLNFLATPSTEQRRSPIAAPVIDTLNLTQGALQNASTARGVTGEALPSAIQGFDVTNPQVTTLLRDLAQKSVARNPSLIDPRYASFLKPEVSTLSSTSPGSGQVAGQAVGSALAVAGLVAAIAI